MKLVIITRNKIINTFIYVYIIFFPFLQLYNYITTTRNSELTELVLYDAKYEFGHQFICRDKEIEKKIE